MGAREVVTMHHPLSGQTQRASRRAYDDVWQAEGWQLVSSEEWTPEEVAKPIDKMKLDELKAHAEEHQIDLGEASKKEEILAVIKAHWDSQADAPAADGSNGGD